MSVSLDTNTSILLELFCMPSVAVDLQKGSDGERFRNWELGDEGGAFALPIGLGPNFAAMGFEGLSCDTGLFHLPRCDHASTP